VSCRKGQLNHSWFFLKFLILFQKFGNFFHFWVKLVKFTLLKKNPKQLSPSGEDSTHTHATKKKEKKKP